MAFASHWSSFTNDAWVLETVSKGYALEFSRIPPNRFWRVPVSKDPVKHLQKTQAIQHLLDIRAIERVPSLQRGQGVYSVWFLVLKKNGDFRAILDLRWLNGFLQARKFKMETWKTIVGTLREGDFLASLDLSEAYLHVPIRPRHRRFLRFCYGSAHFQYCALPFGLRLAPRTFSKILIAPVAHLRSQGVHIYPFLDDLLLRAPTRVQAARDVSRALSVLSQAGFVVNYPKSQLIPVQRLEHLGLILDTKQFTISLSMERQKKLSQTLNKFLRSETADVLVLASLLGQLVSCQGIVPWARYHMRELQHFLLPFRAWIERKRSKIIRIPDHLKKDLSWWLADQRLHKGFTLRIPPPVIVTTDASLSGWGAHTQGALAQGTWSREESNLSINLLELRAIRLALIQFRPLLAGKSVRVRTDNTTAKAYVNRQGGTRSKRLRAEAMVLMGWAEQNLGSLQAEHLAGSDNIPADWLSRQKLREADWRLSPAVFQEVCQRLGTPILDLFASKQNAQTRRFFARVPGQGAEQTDALTCPWPTGLLYAFPPITLLSQVVRRVRDLQAEIILIAPHWPRRPWFPELVVLSVRKPWRLPVLKDLLSQGPLLHPNPGMLALTAWRLRGVS